MDEYTPTYLDLAKLEKDGPPPLPGYVIEHWIRMGCTTPMLGEADAYKAIFAQQLATTLVHGIELVSTVPEERRVLAWLDDDDDELLRRQHAISAHLPKPDFDIRDRLFLQSMADTDCTLLAKVNGTLVPTPMLAKFREEIGDRKIEVAMLENVPKMFAGNLADIHEIMVFLAALRWAAHPMRAAILLLADFAGDVSAQWERAVRARLWFSDRLPENLEDKPDDNGAYDLRYLFKRKVNYTAHDICSMVHDGGTYSIINPPGATVFKVSAQAARLNRVLTDSFNHSKRQGRDPAEDPRARDYLPRLIVREGRNEGFSELELAHGMRLSGLFKNDIVGHYTNRTPKKGLVLVKDNA